MPIPGRMWMDAEHVRKEVDVKWMDVDVLWMDVDAVRTDVDVGWEWMDGDEY